MESSCSTDPKPGLTRVFIWCVPRSLSTVLTKCLSYVDGIQIFDEPCISAFKYGPEGKTPIANQLDQIESIRASALNQEVLFEHAFDDSKCTYGWIRQQLEADYPGKKVLLVRDHAIFLDAKYDTIPPGFRHVFLIRHPYKVFPSYKSALTKHLNMDNDTTNWNELLKAIDRSNCSYEMQFKLLKYVQEHFDANPVIIDADDLQGNPSSILSQFCQAVGIPYSDSLLEWPPGHDIMKTWKGSKLQMQGGLLENENGYFENAMKSRRFFPVTATPKRSELSQDLQEAADYSMPFYEKMYQMRLNP
ncbi:uncharacterized protein [Amphiura filiformis]|uniref:uncharacterized protein n=1 Tax=Amphiura filiformis TaxID=82378 RepID=UPI003B20C17A